MVNAEQVGQCLIPVKDHACSCFYGRHFLSDFHDYSHRLHCPIGTTSSQEGAIQVRKTVLADVSILEIILGVREADSSLSH